MTESNQAPQTLGEFNSHEIYPMPLFVTLAVVDVAAAAEWYEGTLGFSTVFSAPGAGGQPSLVHLRRRRYQDLLLIPIAADTNAGDAPSTMTVSFSAEGEVDALAERACAMESVGRSTVVGPIDTPWNTRDLRVTDPSGHLLVFTARNPNPDPAQVARMQAMLEGSQKA